MHKTLLAAAIISTAAALLPSQEVQAKTIICAMENWNNYPEFQVWACDAEGGWTVDSCVEIYGDSRSPLFGQDRADFRTLKATHANVVMWRLSDGSGICGGVYEDNNQ